MAMYIVRELNTGLFVAKNTKNGLLTSDLTKTRVFSRRCDAKNALNYVTSSFDQFFEIIKCDLQPQIPKKYFKVVYKLDGFITDAKGKHWQPKSFDNVKQALAYLDDSCRECNLHKDYFEIQSISEKEFQQVPTRPSWQDYFLGIALLVSKRSHDIHTQHGSVIAHEVTHRILSTGYNGFPPGMKDELLPTSRPEKYDWMVHAEVNAIDNMLSPPDSAIVYVTGECCTPCLIHLWRKGIKKVVQRNSHGTQLVDDKMRKNKEILLTQTGMQVYTVEPDLTWLQNVLPI